ncbi:S24 family peptidase [Sphingobacterium sp. NPDC055431]
MDENMNAKSHKVPNQLFFNLIQEDLNLGKTVKFNVSGNSMLPFLRHADQVTIKQPINNNVNIGDILLAKHEGKIVLHRFVGIKDGKLVLAGDGNLYQKEFILKDDVLAIVMKGFRDRKELNVNSWYKKKLGMLWYYLRPFRYLISKFNS